MTNKLLVVTSYPEKGHTHGNKTVGVASYTKELLCALNHVSSTEIEVMAEKLDRWHSYTEEGIRVNRFWQRNSFLSLWNLFWKVMNNETKNVLVSFEVYMFGSLIYAGVATAIMFLWKLFGKNVDILLHQVVEDISPIENAGMKAKIINFLMKMFYGFVNLSGSRVIVFEKALAKRLGGDNVVVLPHLVPSVEKISKKKARKILGLSENKKYALCFGYLSPYKGVDWLVENWSQKSGYELIVAGGMNPNHKGNKKIKEYVSKVEKEARQKGIKVTGFVPEELVGAYFSACDVVVLPYRMFMSSSGPLSLALAYGKKIVMSSELVKYSESEDVSTAMRNTRLKIADLMFDRSSESLESALRKIANSKKALLFSKDLAKMRFEDKIAEKLEQMYEPEYGLDGALLEVVR